MAMADFPFHPATRTCTIVKSASDLLQNSPSCWQLSFLCCHMENLPQEHEYTVGVVEQLVKNRDFTQNGSNKRNKRRKLARP